MSLKICVYSCVCVVVSGSCHLIVKMRTTIAFQIFRIGRALILDPLFESKFTLLLQPKSCCLNSRLIHEPIIRNCVMNWTHRMMSSRTAGTRCTPETDCVAADEMDRWDHQTDCKRKRLESSIGEAIVQRC